MAQRLTTEEFIRRAKEAHGDKYDYSRAEYVNYSTPVRIGCPDHGEFWQGAEHHTNGHGCRKCMGLMRSKADSGGKSIEWWQEWSPELAYILGFAFADGSVQRGRHWLRLSQKEREILEDINAVVGGGRITRGDGVWILRFMYPNFLRVLEPYGIIPNKTVHGYWPIGGVPDNVLPDYVRGFFDGDGAIVATDRVSKKLGRKTMNANVVMASHAKPYIEAMSKALANIGIEKRWLMTQDGRNYRLVLSNPSELVMLYHWMYQAPALFIKRKRNDFERVVSYFNERPGHRGEGCYLAKLTEVDVREIRRLRKDGGLTLVALGEMYGVSTSNISSIVNRHSWKWLD